MHEAMLYRPWPKMPGFLECTLCAHYCKIAPGRLGVCAVRSNQDGKMYTLVYGKAIANHIDPIEKKPLFHFLPGTNILSIATAGCNFKCHFCQNWQISQLSKEWHGEMPGEDLPPAEIVRQANQAGCRAIAYTYTEPTIFFEYAYDTARLAQEQGLRNVFVTNGYQSVEALEAMVGVIDAANVDLKSFSDQTYKRICGARLQPVLDTIRRMWEKGIWVEVTTLVVPGQNDSAQELAAIGQFLASVSPDLPWHISRFHPDYKMADVPPTPVWTLHRAAEIGQAAGLKYVYVGNVWGDAYEHTYCPNCGQIGIYRIGYRVRNRLQGGSCPTCHTPIPGCWN
ncbi:MAG: AmmeMemoRadiSam system radical SAM enzyme [Deinococcus sp.]|nr:AmmeMemoRadiSam system radical SAM enzyme [Deinococcus sp.]